MNVLELSSRAISLDDMGFLVDFDAWDETVAQLLADREDIGRLTPEQLDILFFLRDYYRKHRFFPIIRAVCRSVDQPSSCLVEKFADPVQAWKIAGLPNPGEEVLEFRSWNPLGY